MSAKFLQIDKIIETIKLLKSMPVKEYTSNESLDLIKTIDSSFYENSKQDRQKISKTLLQNDFSGIVVDLTKYFSKFGLFEDEIWPCCFYLLRSVWNFTDVNSDLAMKFSCLLPFLLGVLSDDSLQPIIESEDEKLIKITLNILNNIAHHPETKHKFHQIQATHILKSLSDVRNEHLRVLVYLVLAQVVNENEFEKLNDSSQVIENIYFYLKESLKTDDHRYKGISTAEYLDSIAKLAVTQQNKIKLIKCGIIDVIRIVLSKDIVNEKLHGLICFWNLCFDVETRRILKTDHSLLKMIENIAESSLSDDLKKHASGILFTVKEFEICKEKNVKSGIDKIIDRDKSHVMISYNWGSKDTCLKLNNELKSRGFDVWIDVEQIYGSSLASMAEAVENSSVFLMCVSEKYYMSPNCRLEAEYAVRQRKPIVPLLMQSDYMPTGWLGIIMGDKIYYKFSSLGRTFFDSFESMLKEVNRYVNTPSIVKNNAELEPGSVPEKWSKNDVLNWIKSLDLSASIQASSIFDDVDGRQLKELNCLKSKAPESFYSMLRQEFIGNGSNKFQLSDLLKFSCELTKLFI